MLNFINKDIKTEHIINQNRIFALNNKQINPNGTVVYIVSREFRFYDNFAMDYVLEYANKNKLSFEVIFQVPILKNENKNKFFYKNFEKIKNDYIENKISFKIFNNTQEIESYLNKMSVSLLVRDFNPIVSESYNSDCKILEIDGHNIIPARYISSKQEYSAATFRRKVYSYVSEFMTEYNQPNPSKLQELDFFINNNLGKYFLYKNDPINKVTSNLSGYLNFGFISSQRLALEVIKANVSDANKEAFLEELVVRKELSDNFCFYCTKFKTFECIPSWAKATLNAHKSDMRPNIYTLSELENAKTSDLLWNASQKQLLCEGKIEGYLRMYWAKQLLYWTKSSDDALKIAIYLNDKYALDAPSPNGYVGILWSIAGLHDRAFMERPVLGKIRPMTYKGAKTKFDADKYIKKYL